MLKSQLAWISSFLSRFLLLSLLVFSSCSGNRRVMETVRNDLRTSPVFEHGFSGLAVYDPEAKKMLLEYNSEKYFTPASNIKLLTYFAGQKLLSDSIQGLKYLTTNDSLIFSGTGDPSFLNSDFSAEKE